MDDNKVYINIDGALSRLRGNEAVYKTLLRSYAARNDFKQLNADIAGGNTEAAAKTIHTIKGTAGNLSLDEVYKQAVHAEDLIKNGFACEDSVAGLLEAHEETLNRIDLYLR